MYHTEQKGTAVNQKISEFFDEAYSLGGDLPAAFGREVSCEALTQNFSFQLTALIPRLSEGQR
tara:strand:- start:285 stop:473 length:189 start_codon:yes stop_codon:yes gene_type:complete